MTSPDLLEALLKRELRVVPVEATPEMLGAFWRQKNTGTQEIGSWGDATSDYDAYRAMLSASPDHTAAVVVTHRLEFPHCSHAFEVAQMSTGGRMHSVHIGVYRKKVEFGHGEWALTRMLVLF